MKFEVGDMAVHPARGVGEVIRIESKRIGGQESRFYILQIVGSSMTMMVPVDGVDRAGMRRVISKREASKVIGELKKDEVAVTSQPWNRRHREYTEKLQSGSPIEVARVLRDISRLRGEKELSFGERGLLEKARDLLANELALAKGVTREKVLKDFEKALGQPV
ncbi:MAG: CarD family transcriptional regulator [Myxococcota bacterium]